MISGDGSGFRLRAGSPCIDSGDDSLVVPGWPDLDGQARIRGAHVDIGAVEWRPRLARLAAIRLSAGLPRLLLEDTADGEVVLQASSDLAVWQSILTNRPGILEISDADARDFVRRFYRLKPEE